MAAQVLANLPWKEILKAIPSLVTAGKLLFSKTSSQSKETPINTNDDPKKQIAVLVERLQNLEESEVAQAKLTKDLLEQLQGISIGLNEISKRANISLFVGTSALALSVLVLAFVVLR